jgi:hypothetical protein
MQLFRVNMGFALVKGRSRGYPIQYHPPGRLTYPGHFDLELRSDPSLFPHDSHHDESEVRGSSVQPTSLCCA